MDVFAHAMWSGAAGLATRKKTGIPIRLYWAMLWGVFPDVFAFSPAFVLMLWLRVSEGVRPEGRFLIFGRGLREALPAFLQPDQLYHYSHSLIIFLVAFGAALLLLRRPVWVMLAWPLHILMDIPTHRAGRFGTPFLWPLSDYRFNGISWGQGWFMLLNWSAIAATYILLLIWYVAARRRERAAVEEMAASRAEPRP
mgnify:CR=1 FL=1